jgi:polyvinyl alcohol dehydrogenase (cytochrome)
MDGHIRGCSSEDGKILWDYDTVREFPTVNGVKPGAVVVKGMVFVKKNPYPTIPNSTKFR